LILGKKCNPFFIFGKKTREIRRANPEKEREETKNGSMGLRYRHVPP